MRRGLQPDATPDEVRDQLSWTRGELASARRTIQHMSKAMSWIAGHDRHGLDHLDEAMREARARERAVQQARRWAHRARSAEAALRSLADALETDGASDGARGDNQEAVRRIRVVLDELKEPDVGRVITAARIDQELTNWGHERSEFGAGDWDPGFRVAQAGRRQVHVFWDGPGEADQLRNITEELRASGYHVHATQLPGGGRRRLEVTRP